MVALDSLARLERPVAHGAKVPDARVAVHHFDSNDLEPGPHVAGALAGVVTQLAVGPTFPGPLVRYREQVYRQLRAAFRTNAYAGFGVLGPHSAVVSANRRIRTILGFGHDHDRFADGDQLVGDAHQLPLERQSLSQAGAIAQPGYQQS